MAPTPNATWTLRNGTAWVFTAGHELVRPVILAGDAGTELAALAASADDGTYSLLGELRARRLDLILLGLSADAELSGHGSAVEETVFRAINEKAGSDRLTVGGTGRGALAARYALASMEYKRINHEVGVFFSHNGAAPGLEEGAELKRVGDRPQIPLFLRMVDSGVTDDLNDDIADETKTGEAGPAGPLLTKEYGSWLLDRLSR
ncbi:hypothetical protein ACWGQ4_02720 [Streptomyces sp. NPDC055721]|uniref:hypothetical protein n=1 Tax=Streptomyces sp. NPDC127132 TaxID=3345374 RepID=UPI00363401A1